LLPSFFVKSLDAGTSTLSATSGALPAATQSATIQ
jgi:hypothetical protein